MRIGARISLIVVITTLLSGAVAVLGVVAASRLLEKQIDEKFLTVSTFAMENLHRLFLRRYEDVRELASDPLLKSGRATPEEVTARLMEAGRHFRSYAPYASLSYFNLERIRIADTKGRDLGRQHTLSEYWPEVLAGKDFVLHVSTSESLRDRVFHLAHVVRDASGARVGVVVARIAVEELRLIVGRPLALFHVAGPFNVDLLDNTGLVLFSNHDAASVLKARLPARVFVDQARKAGRASGSVVVGRKNMDGKDMVIFARESSDANYRGNDWALVISLPEEAVLGSSMELRNTLLLLIAAIASLALGISMLLARAITRPIASLTRAVAQVGQGRLDTAVPVADGGELGQLGRGFNQMVQDLKKLDAQLQKAATVDRLTGALNRSGFEQTFAREVERANRHHGALSLIFLDVDHFKRINDVHGHMTGDHVLEELARVVHDNIRSTDVLGRWGGEEFILLVPETRLEGAALLAEKIRHCVERAGFEAAGCVTVSCGVAELHAGDTLDSLVRRADGALYAAKEAGRNRVEVAVAA